MAAQPARNVGRSGTAGGSAAGEQDPLAPAWRHLPFYEASQVRDASDFARSPTVFRTTSSISVVTSVALRPSFVSSRTSSVAAKAAEVAATTTTRSVANNVSNRKSSVLIGQLNGKIAVCDADQYTQLGSWLAFRGATTTTGEDAASTQAMLTGRVTHISCDEEGRAITLGEDDGNRFPMLRIWDLRSSIKASDGQLAPRLLAEAKIQHGSKPYPVASFAHTSSLSFVAIGLGDGTVLLLRGVSEVLSSAPKRASDVAAAHLPAVTLPKFKVVHQSSSRAGEAGAMDAVTGLGFASELHSSTSQQHTNGSTTKYVARVNRQRKRIDQADFSAAVPAKMGGKQEAGPTQRNTAAVQLFIVTLSRVLRYTVLGKGAGSAAISVDDTGCALDCAAMMITTPRNHRQSYQATATSDNVQMSGKMVVAREEAIYVIGAGGREMSLAFEGKKSSIRLCDSQLVIISPPVPASAASNSATVRQYVASRDRLGATGVSGRAGSPRVVDEVAKVTIFDLDSMLVAYSGTFEGGVRTAWAAPDGSVNVLCDDGNVTRLDEKTLRQKLDILLRKSLYLLAVSVAKSHAARSRILSSSEPTNIEPLLGDIFRKYGDYLYDKGDFEGAIGQFVKTIGVTQPSYVIRKFLDAQRITNLTTYLQELHARGLANADHTTLLLNCFAKLKDVASLDRFIKRPVEKPTAHADSERNEDDADSIEDGAEDGSGGTEDLPFDLDTAIRVCRQGGYYKHAAYLAQRYGQPDEYVRIQIEDLGDYGDAMQYVRSLPIEHALRNLVRYGRQMLQHDARRTTDLLIELCSGAFEPVPIAVGSGVDASKSGNTSKSTTYLSYLNVGRLGGASSGDSKVVQPEDLAAASGTKAGRRIRLNVAEATTGEATTGAPDTALPEDPGVQRAPAPSSRIFFAHFLNHQEEFIRFLETVALARWDQAIQIDDQVASTLEKTLLPEPHQLEEEEQFEDEDKREQRTVWNTLLELYLSVDRRGNDQRGNVAATDNGQTSEASQKERRQRALALLKQYDSLPYDIGHALIICTEERFDDGTVLLYERMGMYEDILRLYMDRIERHDDADRTHEAAVDGAKLFAAIQRYGTQDGDLYPLVLRYLVATERRLSRHQADVERILTHIFDEALLSPLEVVQMLSKKGVASVGLLRKHLMRALDAQQNDIATNASLTRTYREETREKQADIDALRDLDQPRVFQQSKCSACAGQLDLPSIHFMCRHSFHARCLGDGENECPVCAQSHGVILEIRRNNVQFGQRHDLFINEVEEAEDGFDVVAGMFSKGLFGAQQLT